MLDAGATAETVIEWCGMITPGNLDSTPPIPAKAWWCSELKAREYIAAAKARAEAEDQGDSQATKRSMNRSRTLKIVALAIERGDLQSAIRAQHMLNLIDKSYDEAGADAVNPAVSTEEAIARIDHAAETLALARARGALPASTKPKVIDAESVEDDDDEGDVSATAAGN